jgi:predicted GIY-YIG superfamily endonuclease
VFLICSDAENTVVPAKAGTHSHRFRVSCKVVPNHARSRHILRLQRLEQHRSGHGSEFVKKYCVHRLVHMEVFASPQDAIAREKQLKDWQRDWKIRLIEENNLDRSDLSHLL